MNLINFETLIFLNYICIIKLIIMKDFVENLTQEQIKELMFQLCRSGKVVIPQYYTKEHLLVLTQEENLSEEQIIEIQREMEIED